MSFGESIVHAGRVQKHSCGAKESVEPPPSDVGEWRFLRQVPSLLGVPNEMQDELAIREKESLHLRKVVFQLFHAAQEGLVQSLGSHITYAW